MKVTDELKNSNDYEWAIGMTKLGLKVCGVWPNIKRPNWLRTLISIRVTIATLIVAIFTLIPGLFALVKLFDDISADWSRPRSEVERNIMLKTATVTRNVTIFAYILVIWVILIHHLPLWVAGIVPRTPTNLTDGSRALVMQTIYFYDETLTPTFEITATCQFMSSLVAGSSYTTIDCVFGALILHVSGQLQILEVKVQNLCDHYNKATQYVDKSTKIYHAAYNSEWVNLEKRNMYQIIMIINRAQKPLIVTAGKFAPISLSTFAKLIKTSAGYMSVLLAVKT
ncbi:hypothetical protein G9C98_008345 [Cotesia typhae]|uniref:Odorant receptor n=1 Tax=Cotesia typhae TaxID=2053667 RepID=A0A8J5R865_9HYME|nr:hypothetical protein G9C98_008345 [Cotesia typhae]